MEIKVIISSQSPFFFINLTSGNAFIDNGWL